MEPTNLLVFARPGAAHLSVLDKLPDDVRITVTDDPVRQVEAAPGAHIILNCTGKGEPIERVWPHARQLKWVHSLSAGVEHQLVPSLAQSSIPFTNARGVYRESLGEFVVAAALFFAKDFRRMIRNQEAGRWEQFDVEELHRQTMGVVGYGEIGRAAARRGKALGMRILASRRRSSLSDPDGLAERTYPLEEIGDMMAESDVVVVAAPLTPESRGLVGEREIARMKPTAIIVNVGRGPVIDEPALIRALEQKQIRGAALDVFDKEPLPEDHPFWKLDNVLLSPHCADHTIDWLEQSTEFFVENFRRFQAGEELLNLVDKRAGY